MPRVKRGVLAAKKRRTILKAAKGYRFGRSKKKREARTALLHAGVHAFTDRRDKKGVFRRRWQVTLNAALRPAGLNYSRFIHELTKKSIALDRKIMADLAQHHPVIFQRLIELAKPV